MISRLGYSIGSETEMKAYPLDRLQSALALSIVESVSDIRRADCMLHRLG